MPSPSARPTFLGALPPELQIRVLACLSTKERARLPLVCQALNKLANDPHSLLWEALDLRVTLQNKDAALKGTTRRLLRARGQYTTSLCIHCAADLPQGWPDIFATLLPPLCPQLLGLEVTTYARWIGADNAKFLFRTCPALKALSIGLSSEGITSVLLALCECAGLTSLSLVLHRSSSQQNLETTAELHEALQLLQALTGLQTLGLNFSNWVGLEGPDLPACLPSRLLQLESLSLHGCLIRLPATFSKLHCLTALTLGYSAGWKNLWPAISGLPSLKQLEVYLCDDGETVPPPLYRAAFSTCLTWMNDQNDRDYSEETPLAASLKLPALKDLDLWDTHLARCLNWGSLTSLQDLICLGRGQGFKQGYKGLLSLSRLTCLDIYDGKAVTDVVAAELCQMRALRRLKLTETCMTVLPEGLASAKLTALELESNDLLSFGPAAYRVLERMPALQSLLICVCCVDDVPGDAPPATTAQSLLFLHAISEGLAVCNTCRCHNRI